MPFKRSNTTCKKNDDKKKTRGSSTRLSVSPNKILNHNDTAKKKYIYFFILEKISGFSDDACYTENTTKCHRDHLEPWILWLEVYYAFTLFFCILLYFTLFLYFMLTDSFWLKKTTPLKKGERSKEY